MPFSIVMGVPEMLDYWNSLESRFNSGNANKDEIKIYKLLSKTLRLISQDPRYPSLHTHEISELSARYGVKVFQSYCENRNPRAMRVFWVYGPWKECITIIGVEPPPNDAKNNAYLKIKLSKMGDSA